jgi:hypothetical protein
MPHKKILPIWKRLTKIMDNIKKLPEIPEANIKTPPLTHFGKTGPIATLAV